MIAFSVEIVADSGPEGGASDGRCGTRDGTGRHDRRRQHGEQRALSVAGLVRGCADCGGVRSRRGDPGRYRRPVPDRAPLHRLPAHGRGGGAGRRVRDRAAEHHVRRVDLVPAAGPEPVHREADGPHSPPVPDPCRAGRQERRDYPGESPTAQRSAPGQDARGVPAPRPHHPRGVRVLQVRAAAALPLPRPHDGRLHALDRHRALDVRRRGDRRGQPLPAHRHAGHQLDRWPAPPSGAPAAFSSPRQS